MNALRLMLCSTAILIAFIGAPAVAEGFGFNADWAPAGSADARAMWVCVHGSPSDLVNGCRCIPDLGEFYCWD